MIYIHCHYRSLRLDHINTTQQNSVHHDDVIKWNHFPRYWPSVWDIHRSPVNSPHNGQWRGALMFSLICTWINGWVNNIEVGDLRRHRAHHDVIVVITPRYTLHCRASWCVNTIRQRQNGRNFWTPHFKLIFLYYNGSASTHILLRCFLMFILTMES